MTPEYLRELADMIDQEKLWQLGLIEQLDLPEEKKKILDAGIALRRYAHDVEFLHKQIGTGKSVLITQLSLSGRDVRCVDTPKGVIKIRRDA